MSCLKLRLDKLENEVMGNQQITVILRARPFPGVEHFDPHQYPEKFKRIEGWPLNYNVFAENEEYE